MIVLDCSPPKVLLLKMKQRGLKSKMLLTVKALSLYRSTSLKLDSFWHGGPL